MRVLQTGASGLEQHQGSAAPMTCCDRDGGEDAVSRWKHNDRVSGACQGQDTRRLKWERKFPLT